jgi:asparagine synthase (glutamine-hydrolysing)
MCGIIGSRGRHSEQQIRDAAKTIAHRGPDAFASFAENDVVFAHHRLSILDLTTNGAQPYHFEHLTLAYNGEIYNFKSIRELLQKEGYQFTSDSDTEVVIKAFHKWGPKAVERFIGMFAFALYDRNDNSIYLFRDRIGVKPLYYSLEDGLVFGSELRSILPLFKSRDIDTNSVYEYFRLGYISGEKTIYNHAKKLLPGHYLHFRNGKANIKAYWSLNDIKPEENIRSIESWKEKLHHLLIDAFGLRMVSDVPVGVFLSGGIDSSLVSAILQKHYGQIHTFTISFNDQRYDEAPYAKKIAEHLGTTHTEFTLDIKDAHEVLEKFYDIYDEPFADSSGIPSTIVSRLAAKQGIKVVLSADGGDELFAGYTHYQTSLKLYDKLNRIPPLARRLLAGTTKALYNTGALQHVYQGNIEHKTAAVNELLTTTHLGAFYHSYLANQSSLEMNALMSRHNGEHISHLMSENMQGLMTRDIHHYLPDDLLVKMDRATMYNSIEGREPFLDHRIVELAARMPINLKHHDGQTKWILKEILAEYVPKEHFLRPKKGFSIPIFKWFSEHLDHLFETHLAPAKVEATGILNKDEVTREYKKYKWNKRNGKEYNIEKMWRLLSFMMWWETWHNS